MFCVRPGDYRSYGNRDLRVSGTQSARRFLRFDTPDGSVPAIKRSQQAFFESIRVLGNWWVVQGLAIQPRNSETSWFLTIYGGDHNVVDGNLIDGRDHWNGPHQVAVVVRGLYGDPGNYNTVQRNVIRNGDRSHNANDYTGVQISMGWEPGEDNNWNKVLDNEIYDWGDGISVSGVSSSCNEAGHQHGTIIDGNDVYLTSAKRVNCATGANDPNGGCACAENGIDVKANPSGDAGSWTQITNNRVWGFRPTTTAATCGGSGATGQAITAGSHCPRNVFIARNIASESVIGIAAAGSSWIVAGNLIHNIRAYDSSRQQPIALLMADESSGFSAQFNTIANSASAYDDGSDNTDTRCNVLVNTPGSTGIAQRRGYNHVTTYNSLYQSRDLNIVGSTNVSYSSLSTSNNADYCYWRKRWTQSEIVCVAKAATTEYSPHRANASRCNVGLGAPFGMPYIGFVERPAGCGLGGEGAFAVAGMHLLRRRFRRRAAAEGEAG
ncbi:MAG: hypothetical protein DCC71_24490 [Proteobacteria bacterium]|nr:MAG: hypothetical protein DCC71_24490 [Pseudomonadota bacterium]